jgi:hypothetical protein
MSRKRLLLRSACLLIVVHARDQLMASPQEPETQAASSRKQVGYGAWCGSCAQVVGQQRRNRVPDLHRALTEGSVKPD